MNGLTNFRVKEKLHINKQPVHVAAPQRGGQVATNIRAFFYLIVRSTDIWLSSNYRANIYYRC